MDDEMPYLLLTPGPLTTSAKVRQTMQRDYSSWDADYNEIVNSRRRQLVELATEQDDCSSVLMQGSGTFSVEATIGSAVAAEGQLLVINNGAYGARMATIAQRMQKLGFHPLLPSRWHSPTITSFYDPSPDFDFLRFYDLLKQRRYVIYPGKVTRVPTFRVATIGHLFSEDVIGLAEAMAEVLEMMQLQPTAWWETEHK